MTETNPTCQYVDLALLMQQLVRERETPDGGAVTTVAIGEECGQPAIGAVEMDGVRHHFCAAHVLKERVLRD